MIGNVPLTEVWAQPAVTSRTLNCNIKLSSRGLQSTPHQHNLHPSPHPPHICQFSTLNIFISFCILAVLTSPGQPGPVPANTVSSLYDIIIGLTLYISHRGSYRLQHTGTAYEGYPLSTKIALSSHEKGSFYL